MATPITPSSTPFLERIGLSAEEQKVLLSLLALGPLTAGEISKYTQVKPISKVRQVLASLYEKNYAYNIEGLVDKSIGLYPFRDFAEHAEKDSKKIDKLVSELKSYVAEQIQHFEKVMKDTEDYVRAEKTKSVDFIVQNSEENKTAVETKFTESTTTITSTVDSTQKKIRSATNAYLRKQTETIDAYEAKSYEDLDTFSSDLKAQTSSALDEMSTDIKGKNDAFLSEGTSALDSANSTIAAKTDDLASNLKSTSKDNLEGARDHLLSGLETFATETEGNINILNETLTSATNEQGSTIKEITEEAKNNRIDLNNQLKEGLAESFVQVQDHFATDAGEFEGKINKKLNKIVAKFKGQLDALKEEAAVELNGLIENANASVGDLANKHNEEIAANVDLDTKAVTDGTATMLAKVSEQNSSAIATIGSSTETLNSSTMFLKTNYSADLGSKIEETVTTMHTTISATTEEAKNDYDATKSSIVDKLSTLTTGNSDASATVASQSTTNINSITDQVTTGIKDAVKIAKEEYTEETKKVTKKVSSDSRTGVNTLGETATVAVTDMSTTAKTGIKNNQESSIGAVNNIAQIVETSVRKEIEAVKGGFNDYYKRFSRDALKISTLMMQFKKQNEAFQETVSTYPRPIVETAILYSKDAVFDRLDDMLTHRIKSNVTMVIPDPTDIPTKTLGKVKDQAKMTLISKIDEINHKSIIDDIKASDALGRTKIRKIGMQDMQGYSQYIAFDRDGGEEMLIAFKDETENEWVGILSKSDGFKNVVIGETLGRQALSISRELK
ncbi:MAG: helix-turn-helix domain-containing protein [Candidatus Heimdallarchaeota archaeon]